MIDISTIRISIFEGFQLTYFIKVEWKVSSDGAVEPRFEEGRPALFEAMWTTAVVATHARHTGVYRLEDMPRIIIFYELTVM